MMNVNKNLRPGNLNLAIQNAIAAATTAAMATVTVETKILLIKLFPNFFCRKMYWKFSKVISFIFGKNLGGCTIKLSAQVNLVTPQRFPLLLQ